MCCPILNNSLVQHIYFPSIHDVIIQYNMNCASENSFLNSQFYVNNMNFHMICEPKSYYFYISYFYELSSFTFLCLHIITQFLINNCLCMSLFVHKLIFTFIIRFYIGHCITEYSQYSISERIMTLTPFTPRQIRNIVILPYSILTLILSEIRINVTIFVVNIKIKYFTKLYKTKTGAV